LIFNNFPYSKRRVAAKVVADGKVQVTIVDKSAHSQASKEAVLHPRPMTVKPLFRGTAALASPICVNLNYVLQPEIGTK
jgi:hypothetical protein